MIRAPGTGEGRNATGDVQEARRLLDTFDRLRMRPGALSLRECPS